MRKIAMVASIIYSKSDGIFKKVVSQAKALSVHSERCDLFCLGEKNVIRIIFIRGEFISIEDCKDSELEVDDSNILNYFVQTANLLKVSNNEIDINEFKLIYIRHLIPSPRLIKFLFDIKKSKRKIVYEVPTYPYFYEQLNVSRSKFKAVLKLLLELIYWPFIYSQIDVLSTVFCSTHAKKYSKMISMHNGIESSNAFEKIDGFKNSKLSRFEIIGVGTIYPYHGYDRIIYSLAECKGFLFNGKEVIFHVVGESDEIEKLKELAIKLRVGKNVVFHGKQFGSSLDCIFENCLLGIGTLKLSIRNADIDTALKNIEYLGRNLPVLTSGKIFNINENSNLYKVVKENEKIDLNEIYKFSEEFYLDEKSKVIDDCIASFEWNNIMKTIISSVK